MKTIVIMTVALAVGATGVYAQGRGFGPTKAPSALRSVPAPQLNFRLR